MPPARCHRPLVLVLCGLLALPSGGAFAQADKLPDLGSSAADVISPAKQQQYGDLTLSQLRKLNYTLEDPLLGEWLQGVGSRLAAHGTASSTPFTFFWLRDRQINAFATLGGYIGVNAGLMLAAQDEDELASVLAHEIAHVTQLHVLRAVERAQRDSIPILLAMLGAIAVAQSSGSRSAGDATMAAVVSAQGLMAQRQIDYTRSNEAEADRVGQRTLAAGGYDPLGMARMFERLQAALRVNRGGDRERTPDYLQTHPVTTDRIAEARQNAARAAQQTGAGIVGARTGHLVLPAGVNVSGPLLSTGGSGDFPWAQERVRALSAPNPVQAVQDYEQMARNRRLQDPQRYGMAVAHLVAGRGTDALALLRPLQAAHPDNVWIAIARAQAEAKAGHAAEADALFEALVRRLPQQVGVALSYAQVLVERGTPAAGQRGQRLLRPLLPQAGKNPLFQTSFARLNELAGDPVRAGEAHAEAAYLNGDLEQALLQLNTLLKRSDVDYYARARIEARIAALTPLVLDLQQQGVRDPVLDRRP